ncbi:MAG TPA: PaaI family thioesterase [Gammaproteobacteria bacterium]|nr:PaaI family thioesterase [Gammaproteobacteria bacterium]
MSTGNQPCDFVDWESSRGDPFEEHNGPLYRLGKGDASRCAFRAERKHCNGLGIVHGGMLMSFADFALFVIARPELDGGHGVTLSMTCDFTAPAGQGELIEASGEVVQSTPGMVFVRGTVYTGDRTLLAFSGVVRKQRRRR